MGMDCWDKEISLFSNNNSYSNNKYIENERKIGNTQYPLSFFLYISSLSRSSLFIKTIKASMVIIM